MQAVLVRRGAIDDVGVQIADLGLGVPEVILVSLWFFLLSKPILLVVKFFCGCSVTIMTVDKSCFNQLAHTKYRKACARSQLLRR